jgi:alpha-L-rhamnosidase
MGLLEPDAWKAKWIGMGGPDAKRGSPLLRKEVEITGNVKRARVYVSGLGWSELYINGKKVSDDVLSPGLTDYLQEIQYCTYDVTTLLKQGSNAICMMLGNGWFSASSILSWERKGGWADRPQAILQMTVTYDDGTEKQFYTDETWKTAGGAIVSNQKNSGEVYDARLEKPQWNRVGYDDSQWSQASVISPSMEDMIAGMVGVGTWATQAEYKDIKVTRGDEVLLKCDFADGTKGWKFLGGDWKVQDGALRQTGGGNDIRAITGDPRWTDYTYTLKARKTGGAEGFLIIFGQENESEKSWWNIGGWQNTKHAIQMSGDNIHMMNGSIETGRWYEIKVEVKGSGVKCYLDGKLVQEARKPPCRLLHEGRLTCRTIPAMKVQNTLRPVKVTHDGKNGWVFEFERFFSGWVRLNVKGKRGTTIIMNHEEGEKDVYILKGAPEGEVYEPRFALHPVRHVLVTGLEEEPTLDTLAGLEVYSDVDLYGSFTCSNELFNKIHGNIQNSLRVSLKGIIVDCLHREPITYNEPASFFGSLSIRKFMPEVLAALARSVQLAGSENGDLSDIVPRLPGMNRASDVSQNASYPMLIWYLYECYGDERLLEQHYKTVKAWVEFIGRELAEPSHIVKKGWLGEHMLPKRGEPGWEFISPETPKDFIWTCFYYQNARALSKMSRVLGRKEDEKRYAALAEEIRAVINTTWLDPKTGHYATKSQTSEILPLAIGIVPPENRKQLIDNIATTIMDADGGKFRVGHAGLPGYMESLVENGLGEIVYKTVNTTSFPGWGYMISQGATTVWEGWSLDNGGYKAEESMTMLTGVCRFFYDSIAGIQEPNFYGSREFEPGYGVIRIKPHVLGGLRHAGASIKTIRGIVSSCWKKTADSLVLDVTIPGNATGQVSVPKMGIEGATITESGKIAWKGGRFLKPASGVSGAEDSGNYVTFEVGSGSYSFRLTAR